MLPELLEVRAQAGESFRAGPVKPASPDPGDRDEADSLEQTQVLGDGRGGHVEARGDVARGELVVEDQPEDLPATRLGDGVQDGVHVEQGM